MSPPRRVSASDPGTQRRILAPSPIYHSRATHGFEVAKVASLSVRAAVAVLGSKFRELLRGAVDLSLESSEDVDRLLFRARDLRLVDNEKVKCQEGGQNVRRLYAHLLPAARPPAT